jgi:hypothetical protein
MINKKTTAQMLDIYERIVAVIAAIILTFLLLS